MATVCSGVMNALNATTPGSSSTENPRFATPIPASSLPNTNRKNKGWTRVWTANVTASRLVTSTSRRTMAVNAATDAAVRPAVAGAGAVIRAGPFR